MYIGLIFSSLENGENTEHALHILSIKTTVLLRINVYYKIQKSYNSIYQRQWFRLLLSEKRHYLLHQRLNLRRPDSSNTLSCKINCSLPFWQGSPTLKQWIKPSSEPLVLRFKPYDLNELEINVQKSRENPLRDSTSWTWFIRRGRL